jgi:hypothetical protein
MVYEAVLAGVIASATALLIASADPWVAGATVHPAWVAVLAMSAFYGLSGLLVSVPIIWLMVSGVALSVGAGLSGVERLVSTPDVLLFGASIGVSAIAMVHARHRTALERELDTLRAQSAEDGDLLDGLQQRVLDLRSRNERIDLSVRFWRELAGGLESSEPSAAAQAALEMALVRTGARAGIVRRMEEGNLRNLAWRGRWSAERQFPRDIFSDATIAAAAERGELVLASDIPGAGSQDSDVAVAIKNGSDGKLLGVLALRGLVRSRLGAAELQDLSSVADWLTASFGASEDHRDPVLGTGSDVDEPLPPPPSAPQLIVLQGDA